MGGSQFGRGDRHYGTLGIYVLCGWNVLSGVCTEHGTTCKSQMNNKETHPSILAGEGGQKIIALSEPKSSYQQDKYYNPLTSLRSFSTE